MPDNIKKEDIRITKTFRGLLKALMKLLNERDFSQITVNDICEEAMVSRATFYSHFNDKYDLLRHVLNAMKQSLMMRIKDHGSFEESVNHFVHKHRRIISHLLDGQDVEVSVLARGLIASILVEVYIDDKPIGGKNRDLLTKFCVGGIYNLLLWQVHNRFPPDCPLMSPYLDELLAMLIEWDTVCAPHAEAAAAQPIDLTKRGKEHIERNTVYHSDADWE